MLLHTYIYIYIYIFTYIYILTCSYIESQRDEHPTDEDIAKLLHIKIKEIPKLVQRGIDAKQVLVQANMRLVVHIAKYYKYRGVAYPDLIEEGTFGLMKAVDKYDPDKGFRFSTYASWWIKQSVSRAIAEKSRYVCMYVCVMYVLCIYTCTHTYIHTYIDTYICSFIIYTQFIYILIHTYIHTYIHTQDCSFTSAHT